MIDWIRIDELRDEVGQDDFGDIVGVYFEEVQEALENLRRADTVVTLLGQWKLIRFTGNLAPRKNNFMSAI
ncbi:MAG: hypothetical protein VW297_03615 [Paracoccaceae bacterium]